MNCWEFTNKYKVLDEPGAQLYYLKEESTCCMRLCCGEIRKLKISFQDNQSNEILTFERPIRRKDQCCDCCYPNCTQVQKI